MKKTLSQFALATLAVAVASQPSMAEESIVDTLMSDSKTKLDLRYRYEGVDAGSAEDAAAHTLRTRLSFTSGTVEGVSFGLEFDDVTHIGDKEFNDIVDGDAAYPVVADPEGTEVNQAFVKYKNDSFTATAGRQRINLDDQRFVGGVAWRQNEQTFDAVRLQYAKDALTAEYSFVDKTHGILGDVDHGLGRKNVAYSLINASYAMNADNKLTGFAYLLDEDNSAGQENNTLGLRYVGKFKPVTITASYATQEQEADATTTAKPTFTLIEASGKAGSIGLKLGYEVLGSDEGKGFQTPLATKHKFQGFADKFLATPGDGIKDLYAGAGTKVGPVKLGVTYHQFESDTGGYDYGNELDLTAVYPITKTLKTVMKYADYSADDNSSNTTTDTKKIWLMVQMSL